MAVSMNLHSIIDIISVSLGAKFMPKYFREAITAQEVKDNIQAISFKNPDVFQEFRQEFSINQEHEVIANTLVGALSAGFYISQFKEKEAPVIIYHHGASEIPFTYGFSRIFPHEKQEIPATLVAVRAPFHSSMKDFKQGIRTLSNVIAMLAVSVCVIEQLVENFRNITDEKILIAGTSLGGYITNLHHIHFNTANLYTPLLAGLAMDDAFLKSHYSKAVALEAKKHSEKIAPILNFEEAFNRKDNSNVFPLLAMHDKLVRYDQQKRSYGHRPVTTIKKGHTTGALAYKQLRKHILNHLS